MGRGLKKGRTDRHCVDFNINNVIKKLHVASFRIKKASLALKILTYIWFSAATH